MKHNSFQNYLIIYYLSPEGHGYNFNPNKSYIDGFVILANSMYGRIGKSTKEEVHYVEEMIIHPEYVCTIQILTIKLRLNLTLCVFLQ